MKPLYVGLQNETQENEPQVQPQELQTRIKDQQEKYTPVTNARRLSPIAANKVFHEYKVDESRKKKRTHKGPNNKRRL